MRRLGRDGWKQLIDELESSGTPHKEFAAARELSLHTLRFWLYKFRSESRHDSRGEILPVEVVRSAPEKARTTAVTPTALEAVFPSGVVLRIPSDTDIALVRQLLASE